ncbi:molybdopterin cofactor sulfurase, putative [Pediculus humanus corporis]|uniref:Molybdopterin cofactor sulfurase, putative n=1 Tax=Pediculus humanus subsp. corporis TaxID=121224 RepID=E0VCF8_PEDHC|nr:molybdopterin cofactor sulfurase, putative [Pediculus humanus corporis]EEB11064.1 molybdopterin cofactor sulfurase, putative [Pediculus humanus corporis]
MEKKKKIFQQTKENATIRINYVRIKKVPDYVDNNSKLLTFGTVVTVSGLIYGAWWYNNYIKTKPPKNWFKIGEISELCIYPIKSCKALKPNSFDCTPLGPQYGTLRDRIFGVFDDNGKVISGKAYPRLSQINPKFTGPVVTLSSPDMTTQVEFSLNDIRGGPIKTIDVCIDKMKGWDCGENVAKWLSKCILKEEKGLRLFYYASPEKPKKVNPKITKMTDISNISLTDDDGGYFSESVSYHLISDASTEYLNTRSNGEVISSLNFRPNFVVKGEKLLPFEEDNWEWIKIGKAVFKNISPCTRCIFTTVNPNTGQRSKSMEPLTSMKRYRSLRDPRKRQVMPSPSMGIYLGFRSEYPKIKVSVGDSIYVPET